MRAQKVYFWGMNKMLVYVPKVTNRLHYVFQLVLGEQLGFLLDFTTDQATFLVHSGYKMSYADSRLDQEFYIRPVQLLFEKEIYSQDLKPFDYEHVKAFYPSFHRESALPFDVFAAVFFLVSRYEEYLPFVKDAHGRYKASSSVLFSLNTLQKPLVNIWCLKLADKLKAYYPDLQFSEKKYNFVPTYDIDSAWAYRHKGFFRTLAALGNHLLKGQFAEMKKRVQVLRKHLHDPFDTFDLQLELQRTYKLHPVYFILFSDYDDYDKNIPIRNPAFRTLLRRLGDYAQIGIHPSYGSFDDKIRLKTEILNLSQVLHREISCSRQHFLRMNLPQTYHTLLDLDITDDYTMGYASQPGFRAGIADSFYFYDLDHDIPTPLRIHPFAVMDGSLRDYLNLDAQASLDLTYSLIDEVKKVNGTFILLWHNETLSNEKRWEGWLEVYRKILEYALPKEKDSKTAS